MTKMKKRFFLGIVLLIVFCIAGYLFYVRRDKTLPAPTLNPSFVGDSADLKGTKIYAMLDAPIEKGKNAIWCASFLCAWKSLETDLAKEPISLEGSPELADLLNKSADPRSFIPQDILYYATGWNDKGIVQKIYDDLKKKFPNAATPEFPEIVPDSFVAYAYLEAKIKFSLPYLQNREPLIFTDSEGKRSPVSSFGIRQEDRYGYANLRQQPTILYIGTDENYNLKEFILDLDRNSEPNQIILALIEPESTIEKAMESLEAKISSTKEDPMSNGIDISDVFLVPDMCWHISHHYAEIEWKTFTNSSMKDQSLDVAMQDIYFRLDRTGAELRSEAKSYETCAPRFYIFNRPFLIVMKIRNEKEPFFVMWVDNAELLNPWQSQ